MEKIEQFGESFPDFFVTNVIDYLRIVIGRDRLHQPANPLFQGDAAVADHPGGAVVALGGKYFQHRGKGLFHGDSAVEIAEYDAFVDSF